MAKGVGKVTVTVTKGTLKAGKWGSAEERTVQALSQKIKAELLRSGITKARRAEVVAWVRFLKNISERGFLKA